MPRDNKPSAIIDVWDVGTFDSDLLEVLESNTGLICAYFDTDRQIFLSYDLGHGPNQPMQRPENPYAAEFYGLVEAMNRDMAARIIRAFHYTRLTDEEVTALRRSGVHLSTPETLRRQLDLLVASGRLEPDVADRLYAESPFHSDQLHARSDKFWMASHPLPADDSGVVPLVKHWGGEVASMWVRDAAVSAPLTMLGKARIIEVATPLVATRHSYAAAKAVVATFGRARGAIPEKSAFDLYVKEPLPATAVVAVHTEGDAAFSSVGRTYPPDSSTSMWDAGRNSLARTIDWPGASRFLRPRRIQVWRRSTIVRWPSCCAISDWSGSIGRLVRSTFFDRCPPGPSRWCCTRTNLDKPSLLSESLTYGSAHLRFRRKAFPYGRAKVSADPFCGEPPATPP